MYTVSLLFRSFHDGAIVPELWEESLILVRAISPEEAINKAIKIGIARETTYVAINGSKVIWNFFKVNDVYQIIDDFSADFVDGVEIYSRFFRNWQIESLLAPFDDFPS